ncbi:MAG: sulfate reduction electron transfer complex DsrMKJOP subunit DsrM [Syntrophus sp. SKADARSKE-3]|nr:sulfate reduction electron transfer complex DsrMKJOP subunit DsrM [Syntrophus sp. SKADARSKE-3]
MPFRIPTTCGQEESLPWIKASPLDNPTTTMGVAARMFLELFFFRSLFRNIRMDMTDERPVYGSAKWLWLFGLMFHWSLFFIVVRHLRFFLEPVPGLINGLSLVDGFFEIGVPTLYLTDAALLVSASFLFLRRITIPLWRYISYMADYFALLLIMGIAVTGLWMRHIAPVDLLQIKTLVMSWPALSPVVPKDAGPVFHVHLFLVCILFAWFPFSKLMHMPGIFLSPTRNLANDSRMRRHINPWDCPVKVHTYEEYEDEFHDKMKAADLPVEKE